MKVLVADKFEQSGLDGLTSAGFDVIYEAALKDEELLAAIKTHEPDALVVRSTKVTEPMVNGTSLQLVVRAGAGYNTIDVESASKHGVFVSNCPGKNSIAVAELAMALILSLDRRIPDNVQEFRAGKWRKKEFSKAKGLYGRTIGVIGLGHIGQEVVVRAKAFGMQEVAWSRWITQEIAQEMGIGYRASIAEVAEVSDVLTVHLALTPQTRGLIGEDVFARMKPGAMFINTSRAEVVDEAAMLKHAEQKGLRLGLDVFSNEPTGGDGEVDSPLRYLPNAYVTHHIGASTEQAQEAVAEETVRVIREFDRTGRAPNMVNVQPETNAAYLLSVRHLDRVGVLAHVLSELRKADINIQEMENIILQEKGGAIAYLSLGGKPTGETLDAIRWGNENVRSVVLKELASV